MFILRLIIILSFLLGSPLGLADDASADTRVHFLAKLINTSSGAKQVLNSNDPEVKKLHQKSKDLLVEAKKQFHLGNNAQCSALLDQSAKTMFDAIRKATPVSLTNKKIKLDYDKRKKSVNALNSAFDRIAGEQKKHERKERINKQLKKILENADKLAAEEKHVATRAELDKSYHLLKVSIESMRGGQTLVRSLDFATPEEEYRYELDRNNTHKMLIKLLLGEKELSGYTQKIVTKFKREAHLLRSQAEQAARDNDFTKAISLLEQSTKQLVRSIRSAGVYIPG